MVAVALTGILLGCLIGLRLRVFALLPVEGLALLTGVYASASGALSPIVAFLLFLLFSVSLQASYAVSFALPAALRPRLNHRLEA